MRIKSFAAGCLAIGITNLHADLLVMQNVSHSESPVRIELVVQNGTEVHMFYAGSDFPQYIVPSQVIDLDVPSFCVTALEGLFMSSYDFPSTTLIYKRSGSPYDYTYAGTATSWNRELGTGWIESVPFGQAWVRWYPWVYDQDGGWLYVQDAGIVWDANAWWVYSFELNDWVWTTREVHPWAWSNNQQQWITLGF
jgi:hypothetical protein